MLRDKRTTKYSALSQQIYKRHNFKFDGLTTT
jgi:hypothetical protein